MIHKKIGFLGGGNMTEALVKGMLKAASVTTSEIAVADVALERLQHISRTYGVLTVSSNLDAVREADVIILSVKPQVIHKVLAEISPYIDGGKLVISIAAGITISTIEMALSGKVRIVRVMPNTPALVLAGAAAIAGGIHATPEDLILAQNIFNAVGRTVLIDERLMDAVTGLSGSGPAYVFVIIDALADAGVRAGLPRSLALELAAQTVYGSAKMVLETQDHPAQLRDRVASPAGTTIEGLYALESSGLRAALMNAVAAATERSRELGR